MTSSLTMPHAPSCFLTVMLLSCFLIFLVLKGKHYDIQMHENVFSHYWFSRCFLWNVSQWRKNWMPIKKDTRALCMGKAYKQWLMVVIWRFFQVFAALFVAWVWNPFYHTLHSNTKEIKLHHNQKLSYKSKSKIWIAKWSVSMSCWVEHILMQPHVPKSLTPIFSC